jgi:hypothetical protein
VQLSRIENLIDQSINPRADETAIRDTTGSSPARLGDSSTLGNNVRGSGVEATQSRDLHSFASVDLAGTNNVAVHVGDKQSVVVHADDNLIGRYRLWEAAGARDRDARRVVSRSGAIFYSGNPSKVTQSVTGSGAIIKQ